MIQVKDVKTRQVFQFEASVGTIHVKTKDGVRVKLHPHVIEHLIGKNQVFDGQTMTGTREMKKL